MVYLDTGRAPVIAIVGGGASGALVSVYLLREASARRLPLCVALIDRHGRHGLGQAYSTSHPAHLLNSPADAMSALVDDPGHLTRWAAGAGWAGGGFLPRSAYGRYLTELLAAAERSAQPAARVSRITAQVVAVRRTGRRRALRLHLAADGSAAELVVGCLVNCTGAATDVTATADPLLRQLLDSGLARPDPLRLGLDADARGALRDAGGTAASDIVTLGPLLRGRRYETTAIPEIRDQAAAIARHLLSTQAQAGPGSAA